MSEPPLFSSWPWRPSRPRAIGALAACIASLALITSPATASTILDLDGLGPVKLGMDENAVISTGWIGDKSDGCELASPPPSTYTFSGDSAPAGVTGTLTFTDGALESIVVTRGAQTALGIAPRRSTARTMVRRYRAAGFRVRSQYVRTFGGTFVTVRQGTRPVLAGFARRGKPLSYLGIPFLPVCE